MIFIQMIDSFYIKIFTSDLHVYGCLKWLIFGSSNVVNTHTCRSPTHVFYLVPDNNLSLIRSLYVLVGNKRDPVGVNSDN